VLPPAAITDLAVSAADENSVTLTWTAPGDDSSSGTAAMYEIRMSTKPITRANYFYALLVDPTLQPRGAGTKEIYTATGLSSWREYYFCLRTRDEAFNWSGVSNSPTARTKLPLMQSYHLDTGGDAFYPSWSPDGSTIAFESDRSGNEDIRTMPATGGTATQLTMNTTIEAEPCWSPEGFMIAFSSRRIGNLDICIIRIK